MIRQTIRLTGRRRALVTDEIFDLSSTDLGGCIEERSLVGERLPWASQPAEGFRHVAVEEFHG
jgi:hypothetical protein